MIPNVYTVTEEDTVRSVIDTFIRHRISGVPVISPARAIVGDISDGDIMRYIGRHNDVVVDAIWTAYAVRGDDEAFPERTRHLLDRNVMEVARRRVITVSSHADIEDVAALLGKRRIKKLPVEDDGILVGIISRGDVIRHAFRFLL